MNNNFLYEMVTNKILEALDNKIVPWKRPWDCKHAPANALTGKAYSGANILVLNSVQMLKGYKSNKWLTFLQAQKLGGSVKTNEECTYIVYWNFFNTPSEENKKSRMIPLLKYHKVFNTEQCENLTLPETPETKEFEDIKTCEEIIEAMPNKPEIEFTGDKACYIPSLDKVKMPEKVQFHKEEEFYSTFFHELVHSTGHEKRLNRKTIGAHAFGSETYSKEELVAEIGASMLASVTGIFDETLEMSTSYIESWRKKISEDKKLVITAAGQAQKAVDFVMNKKSGKGE